MAELKRIDVGARMSQAVVHGDTVYTAGVVAQGAPGASVADQTKDILATLDSLLSQAGTDKTKLIMGTIWLSDIATFNEMNEVWDAWVVEGATPVRACVEAKLASPKFAVEIQLTAAI